MKRKEYRIRYISLDELALFVFHDSTHTVASPLRTFLQQQLHTMSTVNAPRAPVAENAPPPNPRSAGAVANVAPPVATTADVVANAPPPLPPKSTFPAHAGWLILFGPPYRSDPFKPGEIDTEGKFNCRYLEVTKGGAFDGYVYQVEVTTEDGGIQTDNRVFVAKDGMTEPIEDSDRRALFLVLQHLEGALVVFLKPLMEEKLRLLLIQENIHQINGGESMADVLRSIAAAGFRDDPNEIQAIIRCKAALSERGFIRDAVSQFFEDKAYEPVITRTDISTKGGLHCPILVSHPHQDWTGHYYLQVGVTKVAKLIAKKVTNRCKQARIRRAREDANDDPSTEPDDPDLPGLIPHPDSTTPSRERVQAVRDIISGATQVEMLAPIILRIQRAVRSPLRNEGNTQATVPAPVARESATAAGVAVSVALASEESQMREQVSAEFIVVLLFSVQIELHSFFYQTMIRPPTAFAQALVNQEDGAVSTPTPTAEEVAAPSFGNNQSFQPLVEEDSIENPETLASERVRTRNDIP